MAAGSGAWVLGVCGDGVTGCLPSARSLPQWGLQSLQVKGKGNTFFFSPNVSVPGYIFTVVGHYPIKYGIYSIYNSKHYAFKNCPKLFFNCRITQQY